MSTELPETPEAEPETEAERRRRLLLAVAAGLIALIGASVPLGVLLVSRTSSASFADTEVLSANRLGAAVLDLQVESTSSGLAESEGEDGLNAGEVSEALFTAINLAPGDRVSGQLEMINAGDVPLRYGLQAVVDDGLLGQWLRFEVWAGSAVCSPDQPGPRVIEDVQIGADPATLVELRRADEVNVLQPGESFVWCIGATLPLETPNEAQGQRLDLTMLVSAEQVVEEGQ